jgi:hypothetical protein
MGGHEAALLGVCQEYHGETEPPALLNGRWYEGGSGQVSMGWKFFNATAVFFLGWLHRNILSILLRLLNRNNRPPSSACDKLLSDQSVRSIQGRLR